MLSSDTQVIKKIIAKQLQIWYYLAVLNSLFWIAAHV